MLIVGTSAMASLTIVLALLVMVCGIFSLAFWFKVTVICFPSDFKVKARLPKRAGRAQSSGSDPSLPLALHLQQAGRLYDQQHRFAPTALLPRWRSLPRRHRINLRACGTLQPYQPDGRRHQAKGRLSAPDFFKPRARVDRDHVVASFMQNPQNTIAELRLVRALPPP